MFQGWSQSVQRGAGHPLTQWVKIEDGPLRYLDPTTTTITSLVTIARQSLE